MMTDVYASLAVGWLIEACGLARSLPVHHRNPCPRMRRLLLRGCLKRLRRVHEHLLWLEINPRSLAQTQRDATARALLEAGIRQAKRVSSDPDLSKE